MSNSLNRLPLEHRRLVDLLGWISLATSVVLATSCTTWTLQTKSPETLLRDGTPSRVRLTLSSRERVTVYAPAVADDRLVGWANAKRSGPRNASYALKDIQSVELSQISKGRTTALVVGVGVTALVVAAAIAAASAPKAESIPVRWSCPFVYSLTDEGWRLDSGTFGGAIVRSLRRTDLDTLDFAAPRDGVLTLKLVNELPETDYVDAIEVLAVDHDTGTIVGPSVDGSIHAMASPGPPSRAVDFSGRDVLARLRAPDGWNWESPLVVRDPESAAVRDGIELEFPRPADAASARLVIDARNTLWSTLLLGQFIAAHGQRTADWYRALDAEPARALDLQAFLARETFLRVSVLTAHGWVDRGLVWEVGPEVVKRQVVSLDLSDVIGETVRIRLDAPASFWLVDFVALDVGQEPAFSVQRLNPRRSGRASLLDDILGSPDGRERRLETGDSVELHFDVPPTAAGHRTRSYMLRSTGWYHIHTATDTEPDLFLLNSIMAPGAPARAATVRLNAALARLRPDVR